MTSEIVKETSYDEDESDCDDRAPLSKCSTTKSESYSILIPSTTTAAAPTPAPLFYSVPACEDVVRNLPAIFASLAPYAIFLVVFALNPFIRVLMTVDDVTKVRDAGGCLRLYNVSSWEGHVMPFALHRLVSAWNCTALDLISTVPYMVHYVIPIIFPVYLALTNRIELISRFFKLLGVTMWIQYLIWYHLPTAPPWAHSNDVTFLANNNSTPDVIFLHAQEQACDGAKSVVSSHIDLSHREGSAFARVDALLGVHFFYGMFSGNPVPFAAFPSGHVAWPTCVLMTAAPGGRFRFAAYVILVSWATLYTSHHYLFDALAAVGVVLLAYWLLNWISFQFFGQTKNKVVRTLTP